MNIFALIVIALLIPYLVIGIIKDLKKPRRPYYLFLDDERHLNDVHVVSETKYHNWVVCRSTADAKAQVLLYGPPQFMSLDHDLGGEDTSLNFLKWLAYDYRGGNAIDPPGYIVHSQNPVGKQNIIAFMESWKKSADLEYEYDE